MDQAAVCGYEPEARSANYLHSGYLWVHSAQPAAAQAHHGVALVQALQAAGDGLSVAAQLLGQLLTQLLEGGSLC